VISDDDKAFHKEKVTAELLPVLCLLAHTQSFVLWMKLPEHQLIETRKEPIQVYFTSYAYIAFTRQPITSKVSVFTMIHVFVRNTSLPTSPNMLIIVTWKSKMQNKMLGLYQNRRFWFLTICIKMRP